MMLDAAFGEWNPQARGLSTFRGPMLSLVHALGAWVRVRGRHLAPGHCSIGIGPCYSVMNAKWPVAGLDALATEWQNAGCMGAVCACTAPPTVVECLNGVCVGSRSNWG